MTAKRKSARVRKASQPVTFVAEPSAPYGRTHAGRTAPRSKAVRGTFKPKTELGRRLWDIRCKAIAEGMRLLSWEELEEEKAKRRGERA